MTQNTLYTLPTVTVALAPGPETQTYATEAVPSYISTLAELTQSYKSFMATQKSAPLWKRLGLSSEDVERIHPGLQKKYSTRFGLEIEVENHPSTWATVFPPLVSTYCEVVDDHSLRHSGLEYKTRVPVEKSLAETIIKELLPYLNKHKAQFSHRTSIHVHCNMMMKTAAQAERYIFWYFFAEKRLFDFVGRNRNYNNFCVPLHAFVRLKLFAESPKTIPKYAALGGCRYSDLGTLEWRHMPGTFDQGKVLLWLTFIENLDMFTQDPNVKHPLDCDIEEIQATLTHLFPTLRFSMDEIVQDYFHLKGLL